MTRSNRMKFRLRDFCNGANLRRADLERRAVHLISLRSKCFRAAAVSEQRTENRSQRPCKKWDIFWFSLHFSRGQNWKSRFSSFLGLSLLLVSRKRLLRRLHALIPVRQSERARALLFRKEAMQRFFSLYHNARTPLAFLSSSKFSWWNNNSSLKFTVMGVKELEQWYCTTCKSQACGRQVCALCAPRLAVDNFTGLQIDYRSLTIHSCLLW